MNTVRSRRSYIDWARGVAVLLMIEAHTTDAWTRAASKTTVAFGYAGLFGGFAAPAFLWLAGVSIALSAERTASRNGTAAAILAICRRGLEIFILAFLFRLQTFIVSPGSHPVALFRVDILNILGPAIVAAALLWAAGATTARRVIVYGAAATLTAMITPVVRQALFVNALPVWVQWYIRPSADYTTFTMFPWVGLVFAGAASGALLAAVADDDREGRMQWALGTAGALLVALGLYTATRPSLYRLSSFWTSSPTWFAIRVGILMLTLSALYGLARLAARRGITCRPLARLGQRSLFVDRIHVELVYGYAASLLRGRLPLSGSLVAFAAFSTLMYGAVIGP